MYYETYQVTSGFINSSTFGGGGTLESSGGPATMGFGGGGGSTETLLSTTYYYYNEEGNVTRVVTEKVSPVPGEPKYQATRLDDIREEFQLRFQVATRCLARVNTALPQWT